MDSGEGKGEMSKLKTNSGYEIAFSTNVGSHMWKMNHENSDTDVFECYFLPTREILMGRLPNSHFSQDKENKVDTQVQEISKVTTEIIKEISPAQIKIRGIVHLAAMPKWIPD